MELPILESQARIPASDVEAKTVSEQIVEIVSDSGEGAQTCGQMFGTVSAKMGNGVWTVEIIPAEIEPPSRSQAGASGNRIRFGTRKMTNSGDTADVVVAFSSRRWPDRFRASTARRLPAARSSSGSERLFSNSCLRKASPAKWKTCLPWL